jgi:hypothetical protein
MITNTSFAYVPDVCVPNDHYVYQGKPSHPVAALVSLNLLPPWGDRKPPFDKWETIKQSAFGDGFRLLAKWLPEYEPWLLVGRRDMDRPVARYLGLWKYIRCI